MDFSEVTITNSTRAAAEDDLLYVMDKGKLAVRVHTATAPKDPLVPGKPDGCIRLSEEAVHGGISQRAKDIKGFVMSQFLNVLEEAIEKLTIDNEEIRARALVAINLPIEKKDFAPVISGLDHELVDFFTKIIKSPEFVKSLSERLGLQPSPEALLDSGGRIVKTGNKR